MLHHTSPYLCKNQWNLFNLSNIGTTDWGKSSWSRRVTSRYAEDDYSIDSLQDQRPAHLHRGLLFHMASAQPGVRTGGVAL